jgi:hypothetical protein
MPQSKRFLLRLKPDLFEALRRWADEDLRSINAQIEYLLTDQARRAGRLPPRGVPRPEESDVPPPDEPDAPPPDAPGLPDPSGATRRAATAPPGARS